MIKTLLLVFALPALAAPPAAPSAERIRPILVGQMIPDAALRDLEGKPVSPSISPH